MADLTAWRNFRKIIRTINHIGKYIGRVAEGIDELKVIKEEVLDDPALRAELKKIIDIYPQVSIQGLADDYAKLKALKEWLEQNDYISDGNLNPL